MNILMLHPHDMDYDPWTIRILESAKHLALRGHSVTLGYVPKRKVEPHEKPVHEHFPENIAVHRLGVRNSDLYRNTRQVMNLARNADIVHVQKCFPVAVVPCLWAAYLLDLPVHYDWDDYETAISRIVCEDVLVRHKTAIWERRMPSFVDTLTYSSEGVRQLAIQCGFPQDRMWWAPVGANREHFAPAENGDDIRRKHGADENTPIVLYLGQLEGAAYAELAARSMEFVYPKHPDAMLWIVGGGRGLEELRRFCDTIPWGKCIRLLGYVPHEEVPRYLAAATVCVASFEENAATVCKSPLKIAEYLAAGKAIVASGIGEVPRMLESCGIIVDPGNPEALAIGINGFLEDSEFRIKYERLARKKAEDIFNWAKTAETLEMAYMYAVALRRRIKN
ncbi:MAG TPA: glycosyltransferase [bacterium]|nr:glycosyltransferase [bacterium]HQL62411.1 glycosyltransferase [bacterium]